MIRLTTLITAMALSVSVAHAEPSSLVAFDLETLKLLRNADPARGQEIAEKEKCAKCHGPDLAGQRTAPKLTGLSKRWTGDALIAYLRDPRAVQAATPRLAYLAEKYPIEMPAYPHTDEQVLRGLIGYLLAN